MDDETRRGRFFGKLIDYPLFLVFLLFMLAFPAVAVCMGWRSVAMVQTWREAQGWVRTPATIEHLELMTHSDGESTTCEVQCRYRYVFNGQTFRGTRVGLVGGSDNIGSWQQDTYKRLQQHFQAIESDPAPCWVNPDNPAEAVLDRELRKELLVFNLVFVVVFGGVSVAVGLAGFRYRRRAARLRLLQAQHPDQPGLWKGEWTGGRISPRGPTPALWLLAVFWNVVSLPVAGIVIPLGLRGGRLWTLGFVCFPLIGIGLLAAAIVQTRRYRRFRGSRLELGTFPAAIGGSLRGTLFLAGDLTGIDDVNLSLQCIRNFVTRRGGESESSSQVLWQQKHPVPTGGTTFGLTELQLPVDFSIPPDCRPTDESDESDTIRWQLQAQAKLPGADLDLKFDVPVFRIEGGRSKAASRH